MHEKRYTPRTDMAGRPLYKSNGDDWIGALSSHLGRAYTRVTYITLREIRLAVFIRQDKAHHLKADEVQISFRPFLTTSF